MKCENFIKSSRMNFHVNLFYVRVFEQNIYIYIHSVCVSE